MRKNKTDSEEIIVEETLENGTMPEDQEPNQGESADSPEVDSASDGEKSAMEELQAKADDYLDGWQRARAEFANYKKRVERERETTYKYAAGDIIRRFLPVVDDLERALKNGSTEGEGVAWAEGVELIYRKLLALLDAEGITPMDAEGAIFDPNLHEAVVQTPSDEHESEQVIEVLQQGYMIGERVLRPAMVRVAA